MLDHVIKEDTDGPNLAFDMDHFWTYFELGRNQILVTVTFVQIERGSKLTADFAHGREIADLEYAIFVYDKLRVKFSEDNVLFVEFRQGANEILDDCKCLFNRKRASSQQYFGQWLIIIVFSNPYDTVRIR